MWGFLPLFLYLSSSKIYFSEQFDDSDNPLANWTFSTAKSTFGKMSLYLGNKTCGYRNKGIQTTEDNKFYSISSNFAEEFSTANKDLIFLYTMRATERIGCTGSYMKLLPRIENPQNFDDSIPCKILFGPDVCGTDAEIKFMVEYNNKLYKLREKVPYLVEDLGTDTHLFTMILYQDQNYEIRVDNETVKTGDLLTDLDLKEPRMIPDNDAMQPADWDDREKIENPEDKKPDDWVKDQLIVDKTQTRPDDWDDELFGKWEPRVIFNPDYRGEYRREMIDNPNYQGKWTPPIVKNPYFTQPPNSLEFLLGSVGLEVWQVESKTIFSNILVTDSIDEANTFISESYMKIPKTCERSVKKPMDDEF